MRRCGLLLSGLRMLRGISDMFSMEEDEFGDRVVVMRKAKLGLNMRSEK